MQNDRTNLGAFFQEGLAWPRHVPHLGPNSANVVVCMRRAVASYIRYQFLILQSGIVLLLPGATRNTIATFFADRIDEIIESELTVPRVEILKLLFANGVTRVELHISLDTKLAFRVVNVVDGVTAVEVAARVVSIEFAVVAKSVGETNKFAVCAQDGRATARVARIAASFCFDLGGEEGKQKEICDEIGVDATHCGPDL